MKPKIEVKSVKYNFTPEEMLEMGQRLSAAISEARNIEDDLASVKAQFKAKMEAAGGQISSISSKIASKFEMREQRCRVVYYAKERKKRFFLENDLTDDNPVHEEPMAREDYQLDLLQADSEFDQVTRIPVFEAGKDRGEFVVGSNGDDWFCAVRFSIGSQEITERLDTEQAVAKERAGAIKKASKRAKDWIVANLGKDALTGFKDQIEAAVKANEEIVE